MHMKPLESVGVCIHACMHTRRKMYPHACARLHIYLTIKELQLAAGTLTDIQTLISIQATQTHFQVLSNEKGDKMLFTISASSPLRVKQSTPTTRPSKQHFTQKINRSCPNTNCCTDSFKQHVNNYSENYL